MVLKCTTLTLEYTSNFFIFSIHLVLCAGSTSIAQHLFPIYIVDINEYQSIQGNKKASKNNTLYVHYIAVSSLHWFPHTQVQNTTDGNSERTYQRQIKSNLEIGNKEKGGKTQLENLPLSMFVKGDGFIYKASVILVDLSINLPPSSFLLMHSRTTTFWHLPFIIDDYQWETNECNALRYDSPLPDMQFSKKHH